MVGYSAASKTAIADEVLFNRFLSLERKRSERTEEPFALALVEIAESAQSSPPEMTDRVPAVITAIVRATDFVGWYQQGFVVGVICTALNGASRHAVQTAILNKIDNALRAEFGSDGLRTRTSFHFFPEDREDSALYPEFAKRSVADELSAAIKRFVDVAGSSIALLCLSPLLFLIALAIKLTSKGPVFFRQKRIGHFGKEFTMLKFRSMVADCDSRVHLQYVRELITKNAVGDEGAYKIKNDPRVTPIGRLLRRTSFDELPQFLNVLRGDMSLVGPRPPIPYEVECYCLWHRRRIQEAKPGITGLWQVHGRSRTTFDEMVRLDLQYSRQQSLRTDLTILLKTPRAVFSGDGAY